MLRHITLLRKSVLDPRHTVFNSVFASTKVPVDYSKVPVLQESDLSEQFVRGSGPGGQATNKTSNCVILKHLPTGLTVRCHDSRFLEDNRKIARKRMITRLDNFLNGENSVEAQTQRELKKRKLIQDEKARERLRIKKEFKTREGLD